MDRLSEKRVRLDLGLEGQASGMRVYHSEKERRVLLRKTLRAGERRQGSAVAYPCSPGGCAATRFCYRGILLIRNRQPVEYYNRTMPRLLWRSWGGGGSYEQGTPVALPAPIF